MEKLTTKMALVDRGGNFWQDPLFLNPLLGVGPRLARYATNLGVQGGNCGAQTRRDDFRVMLQSSLGIGMSQMALHVFNGGMVLHVRG